MKIWAVEKKWISFEAQILFCTAGLPPFLTSVCVCLDQPSLSRLPSCRCSAGCLLHQSPSTLLLGRSPVEAQGFSNIWKETKKAQTWGLKVPPGEALLLPSGFWVLQRTFQSPCCRPQGPAGPWMPQDSGAQALTDVKCSLVNDELEAAARCCWKTSALMRAKKPFRSATERKPAPERYSLDSADKLQREIKSRGRRVHQESWGDSSWI